MKTHVILLFLFLSFGINAQEKNIFLDRDFWKGKPTIAQIKQKIKEGHDPIEKGPFAFDGTAYGIIDDAPVESLKYMLTLKGNPANKQTHGGIPYLLWAAYKGNKDLVKHLLELGADPNFSSSRGTNMLLMAAIGGVEDKSIYDLIFSYGIEPSHKNKSGANALMVLSGSKAKDLSIFQYFLDKGVSIKCEDNDGNNLFNYAARGGNLNVMKLWVNKGVSYKTINKKGENPVLFASYGRRRRTLDMEVFNYLSNELKMEIDMVNWEGKSPLHLASRRATPELLDFFISKGVSPNQVDENGNIALINSVSSKTENLEKLLPHTNNINHKNNKGESALTLSIMRRSKKAFDILIEKKADPLVSDKEGMNLLHHVFNGYSKKRKEEASHMIAKLLEAGVDPKSTDKKGNNLAHIAIEKSSPFLLEKAIELGANINNQNNLNLSPLHLAAMQAKNKELLNLLLENGANKYLTTDFNESAYDLAMENEILKKEKVSLKFLRVN
ncbi:ankyrin repeat domain-containing protein [Tenacibaculum xiamenense]|uniref:ankyrin repeat domain-containing protein n=1 Tax=Tenacibaculum xiamenense TaxID=1261553 RepID=UPI0038931BF4